MNISRKVWGDVNGAPVYLFTFSNARGQQVSITNYGCIVTQWLAPDKQGNQSDVVLGFGSLDKYLAGHPHFGAIAGRVANRIANGKFCIGNTEYALAVNNGPHHLHGGINGFDKKVWEPAVTADDTLQLRYTSSDGEEGYPGNLDVRVTYRFTDDNELVITFDATTDHTTPVNLTNHSYFNLSGDCSRLILNHELVIHATAYTPSDAGYIPTGEIVPVHGTPLDFMVKHAIGDRIEAAGGYDHNFVLDHADGSIRKVAELSEAASGRRLEVFTDLPGLQLYTGNSLDGTLRTDEGKAIKKHAALCLETQGFPDAVNKPSFPSVLLHPGEHYHTTTCYRLTVS
ncbi:aldose epimerase family protein [Chitinophagaceae bacterium MMS25-I14]